MRRILLSVLFLALLAAGGVAGTRYLLERPLALPGGHYRIDVPAGASLGDVSRQLSSDGLLQWPLLLNAYGRVSGAASRIRAGEYRFAGTVTLLEILDTMVAGRVVLHGLTIVEGWTATDVLAAVRRHPGLVNTLEASDARSLAAELALEYPSAEGAFLPETYHFPRGTTDREILLKAHQAQRKALDAAWAGRSPELPLRTPYEMLTLASIVEKETGLAAERPMIAGVFVRRLRLGMRLQTDPTVIYGLGSRFDGNLTRRNLESDTPWNTYTRDGLPPTPIAMPGVAAIQAAAQPLDSDALYFVATGDGSGAHRFSSTLDEHLAAIRAYHAALKARKDD